VDVIQTMTEIDLAEIQRVSNAFESKPPQDVLRWGIEKFKGGITLACSFGAEDVALVDMIARIDSSVPVFFLDTDYLFPETFEVRDRIIARYGIRPFGVKPLLTIDEQATQHGPDLYARQPDQCCKIRKVEPLRRHLGGFQAWITGIRRDQAPTRANAGLANDVPYNVLHDRNYPSIGCWPCTREVKPGEDPRAGRWANFSKKECGLHVETGSTAPVAPSPTPVE